MNSVPLYSWADSISRRIIRYLFPDEKYDYLEKARRLVKLGKYSEAKDIYNYLISKYPDSFWIHMDLAYYYICNNKYDEAIIECNKARKMKSSETYCIIMYVYILLQKMEYGKAIEELSSFVNLNPKYELAHEYMGYAYFGMNDYNNAIKYLNKAKMLGGKSGELYFNLGNSYEIKGNNDYAVIEYKKAINQFRKNNKINLVSDIMKRINKLQCVSPVVIK